MKRCYLVFFALVLLASLAAPSQAQATTCGKCVFQLLCTVDECWIVEACGNVAGKNRWTCEVDQFGCSMGGGFCQFA